MKGLSLKNVNTPLRHSNLVIDQVSDYVSDQDTLLDVAHVTSSFNTIFAICEVISIPSLQNKLIGAVIIYLYFKLLLSPKYFFLSGLKFSFIWVCKKVHLLLPFRIGTHILFLKKILDLIPKKLFLS